MPRGPIRRGQLITTFGVGALTVIRDGTSLICGSLDHWYERETSNQVDVDEDEYVVNEWRLERLLGVNHFRLPPDWRKRFGWWRESEPYSLHNEGLTIPFLRFPLCHFCPSCRTLVQLYHGTKRPPQCAVCAAAGKTVYPIQVPFVTMCDCGHIQDFPWTEWVHKSVSPECKGTLKLEGSGGAGLYAQKVSCGGCGEKRSLAKITEAKPDGSDSYLSASLSHDGTRFLCQGIKLWTGRVHGDGCGRPLRGTLRNALNVYYPDIRSAIFLPEKAPEIGDDVMDALAHRCVQRLIKAARTLDEPLTATKIRERCPNVVEHLTDSRIEEGLEHILPSKKPSYTQSTPVLSENQIRVEEYNTLRKRIRQYELEVDPQSATQYSSPVRDYFMSVSLLPRLRETRALNGFSRVYQENVMTDEQRQALLWKSMPENRNDRWLPAIIVNGEGIFLELKGDLVSQWEQKEKVRNRTFRMEENYARFCRSRHLTVKHISPRLVLVHTLAHLLINRLVFECGYSSASLRERLYVSDETGAEMCGALIYTAAGDSDGTLGGLVRIGRPGHIESVLQRSLDLATWCSSDPVCMEMGNHGQGPDSCNLAACHNCTLLPETACERYNRFLDRGLLVGDPTSPSIGFFEDCLS